VKVFRKRLNTGVPSQFWR